jgi:hypothetical protein
MIPGDFEENLMTASENKASKQDGDRPGKNALKYITYWFPQSYAISLAWTKLGSHVVRYEDLLVDPLSQLREVTSKIVPLDEERLKAADCQRRFVRIRSGACCSISCGYFPERTV